MSVDYLSGPPPFVANLHLHGDRLAVVAPDGTEITYRDLAERVRETSARLGPQRRLVMVAASNDVEPLVTYLAALHGGHPVLLVGGEDRERLDDLVGRYDPDVLGSYSDGSWRLVERHPGSSHALHPELALLLATSGSTGSPKLVRLSAANLASNASSIASYLDIRETDRAALTLPLQYCYGLSVVNSNLLRGAAVLLSEHSVTDPRFWSAFRRHGGTSIHGVPYTFELLDRVGFAQMRLPHLRYVTQAGGRLEPSVVRRYAELGARDGWRFVVMYGQTEATARMAFLPPELAASCPSAIGIPIPGGSFEIEHRRRGVGELVYRGPNVMLGYAHGPDDLARGRTVEALRTGDLARRRPDGLYEVVGRRSRFIKPFGLRIDLDHLERQLADEGHHGACTGSDRELVVAVTRAAGSDELRRALAQRLGLPLGAVRVVVLDELPRRDNGKLDHRAIAELDRPRPRWRPGPRRPREPGSVHDAFRTVFGIAEVPDGATFVSLGGDSLSYVQMTVALQRVLGHLPDDWPTTPIERLARLRRRHRFWVMTETAVILRAVAIVLVVGSHIGLFHVLGGAHVLLGVAGWAFARFVLANPAPGGHTQAILRGLVRIAVPSMVWIAWRAAVQDDIQLRNALLVNYLLDPGVWGYWFVETLCQIMVLLAAVLAIPAVRRLEQRHPFGFALAVLLVALVGRLYPDPGNEFSARLMSPHLVLWIFALGWLGYRARTGWQRGTAAVLVLALVPGFFHDPLRDAVVVAGMLLLLVPRLPLPRPAIRPTGAVAAGSLAIYLTHYAVYPELLASLPPVVVVAVCIGVGVGCQWLLSTVVSTVARVVSARRWWREDGGPGHANPVPTVAAAVR
ncbi:AMP-binding protein [Pseudonocardia hispaniensis]|uniref:AMP-binding protein n=1 Tax=Pseudonocardia hispaniensis TaxID=904933 RepID=A0ABW1J515_9PSEU